MPLLHSLVQVSFCTLRSTVHRASAGPNDVLLCQDVCHNTVCSELLRLRLRVLEVQIDLSHSHSRCYDLFILWKLEHSGNREMRGYACVAHQTNITKRVFAVLIRKHHLDSVSRSCMPHSMSQGVNCCRFTNRCCTVCPASNVNG